MEITEVKWLIEDFDPDDSRHRLVAEVRRQGMRCEVLKYKPFESGVYDCFSNDHNQCVIFQGSLNLGRQLRREKKWIPGVWCDLKAFQCTSYYPDFGQYLFNQDYIMLPLREVGRRKVSLFSQHGDQFFIRPNSGFKTYTGQIVTQKGFDKDYEWMLEFSDDDAIAVISPVKYAIDMEWRFIICDRRVITGSTYKKENNQIIHLPYSTDREDDVRAFELAESIAKVEWQPESIYSADIVQYRNGLCLMELNSFSCSGLYACDLKTVVQEATALAIKEWEEYQCL